MSNNFYCSKSAQNSPKAILSSLTRKNFDFSFLSQDCMNLNLIAWESTAKNKWLRNSSCLQTQGSLNTDYFLALLKRKENNETEYELKNILFGLIKAYEKFNNSSKLLNSIHQNNKNLIKLYNKVKKPLTQRKSQETNLIYLRNLAQEKHNSINSLQAELKLKKSGLDYLKTQWDSSENKNLLEKRLRYCEALVQCREDQRIKLIEISMIDQAIELERTFSSVNSKLRSDALTENLRNTKTYVLNTIRNIKLLETRKVKIQVHIENLTRAKMNKSLKFDHGSSFTANTKNSNLKLQFSTQFDTIIDKSKSLSSKSTPQIKIFTRESSKLNPSLLKDLSQRQSLHNN